MASERLQKILAQAGIASRRKAEELIQEGLVTVNGKIAQIGDKAEWGEDAIKVSGKLLLKPETLTYVAIHKPKSVISALTDPEGRPTLAGYLKSIKTRLFPIGRLDFNVEGLMLLTNDGAFAERVQKQADLLRIYLVKVKGHPNGEMIARLNKGARLGDGYNAKVYKPHHVKVIQELDNKTLIQVALMGPGTFDLKAFFEIKGFLVDKVIRTHIGHIALKAMKPGEIKFLKASQAYALLDQPELGAKILETSQAQVTRTPKAEFKAAQDLHPRKGKGGTKVIKPLAKPVSRPQKKSGKKLPIIKSRRSGSYR
jgi:23S rRNA pseudouridine2605 synthase